MSSKSAAWLTFLGVLWALAGAVCLPAYLKDRTETDILALGACLFSTGMLIAATGFYFKARAVTAEIAVEPATTTRRTRGGCELCGSETPAVYCRVHQLHMCAACLTQHYDVRSCVYVPSTRHTAGRAARAHA